MLKTVIGVVALIAISLVANWAIDRSVDEAIDSIYEEFSEDPKSKVSDRIEAHERIDEPTTQSDKDAIKRAKAGTRVKIELAGEVKVSDFLLQLKDKSGMAIEILKVDESFHERTIATREKDQLFWNHVLELERLLSLQLVQVRDEAVVLVPKDPKEEHPLGYKRAADGFVHGSLRIDPFYEDDEIILQVAAEPWASFVGVRPTSAIARGEKEHRLDTNFEYAGLSGLTYVHLDNDHMGSSILKNDNTLELELEVRLGNDTFVSEFNARSLVVTPLEFDGKSIVVTRADIVKNGALIEIISERLKYPDIDSGTLRTRDGTEFSQCEWFLEFPDSMGDDRYRRRLCFVGEIDSLEGATLKILDQDIPLSGEHVSKPLVLGRSDARITYVTVCGDGDCFSFETFVRGAWLNPWQMSITNAEGKRFSVERGQYILSEFQNMEATFRLPDGLEGCTLHITAPKKMLKVPFKVELTGLKTPE